MRPVRYFADAAAKFIDEDETKGAADNAQWLLQASEFIGKLALSNVHDETLKPFVGWCRERGNKSKTINHKLAIVRRVLNLASRKWRDPTTGLTWLETPPLLSMCGVCVAPGATYKKKGLSGSIAFERCIHAIA